MNIQKNFKFTNKQIDLFNHATRETTQLIAIDGLYGTGKTAFAVYTALELINRGRFDKILYVRNPVEATKHGKIGHIPGTAEEKLEPYAAPIREKVREFVKVEHKKVGKTGATEEHTGVQVEVTHLGYVRGRTFRRSVVIIDEASSLTKDDFLLLLTRCADDVLIFVLGDSLNQSDIGNGWLAQFCKAFDDQEAIDNGVVVQRWQSEEDIVRGSFIKFALKRLGKL